MGFGDLPSEVEADKLNAKWKKNKHVKSSKEAFKDADKNDEETKLRDTVDYNSGYDDPSAELRFK